MKMPRGRKPAPKNYDEQIAMLEAQIEEHKQSIDLLKGQLKELRAAKRQQETEALLAAIEASGKTLEEVLEALQRAE